MRVFRLLILLIVSAILYYVFLAARVDGFIGGYIESEYQSEGATIRVAMNLLPALLLISWPRRFGFTFQQLRLWRAMAFTAVACALMLVLLPSNSTAVDRIALYVIPLQLVIAYVFLTHGFWHNSISTCLVYSFIQYCRRICLVKFCCPSSGWLPYVNVLFL